MAHIYDADAYAEPKVIESVPLNFSSDKPSPTLQGLVYGLTDVDEISSQRNLRIHNVFFGSSHPEHDSATNI